MGLFQKKIVPITVPKYTLGHQEVVLVVGLGNIGKQYDNTRHNTGFMVLDEFAKSEGFNPWVDKTSLKSILCAKIIDGKKVILCKPSTYMNDSGQAIALVQNFYKIADSHTCVIYDELALDFGTLRTARGGSDAGHNGIKSLTSHTENNFWRIRIGIGPKSPAQIDTADFVLQAFSKEQVSKLPSIKKEAMSLVHEWLSGSAKPETRKIA